jgi:mannose/cellobiose epimerase-like protein (N-acyl-D-glucosamine 2-epimerase family)
VKRRAFIELVGAGAVQLGVAGYGSAQNAAGSAGCRTQPTEVRLAGMSLPELRQRFYDELFQVLLPFWDKHGIDHENGGVMCGLDYDGTRVSTEKLLWFQGRAIWVYSFLYNHFGKDPQYLEVARKAKEFVFKYALQEDGWWAEVLSQEGKVLRPFSGDTEGMYFLAEGLQEYAAASGDGQSREIAFALLKKLFRHFDSPDFRYRGADFRYLWGSEHAMRPQGLWFLNLGIATQMLKRWNDPEIAAIADRAVEAIMNKHYNPDIGLNTEILNFDFSRPKEEERKSRLGHSIEALWMVMDEATRRKDDAVWETCAERIHHHLDVGWDNIYGGLSEWINVDQACYQWPAETPVGTSLELHFVGEYEYKKSLWAQKEVLIATLNVFERNGPEWAARYFGMAYKVINEKFSQKKRGYPAGYILFADRRITSQPHVGRQDNYHPLRQLMLNILILDGMIRGGGSPRRQAGDA